MRIMQIVTGPMAENCYLLIGQEELLVVDPGSDGEKIVEEIKHTGKIVAAILLTHAHFDHFGALDFLLNEYPVPVFLSSKEAAWLQDSYYNLSEMFGAPFISGAATHPYQPMMALGEFSFQVVETPGHSFGSVSLLFSDFAIVGDTLFKQSIGRTDFPTGDKNTLLKSITEKLCILPKETLIFPGHGENTTIGSELIENPFLTGGNLFE
ncbi:MBL fold metallo-hydrolase [Enterococcus timonensis]|uniref:MBL fold metallo-hydrolase n=1 Tax=Enterococcus timonensis TaxID=1852364 RepID=UPI0008DA6E14|nr:MBL fold metallo-hydrolase [Enterococcus timonensis]